jgi:hypothetical protein
MELENISAHLKKLSADNWEKLFALIPRIESIKEFSTGGDSIEDTDDPGSYNITPEYDDPIVFLFLDIMQELDLIIHFDWPSWDEGREIVKKGNYSNLDTVTLLKIMTAFIRNNRFCDGALAARFEDRTIEKILKELKKNIWID